MHSGMPVTTALITPPLSIPSTSSSKQPAASDYVSEPSSSLRSTPYPQAVVHRCAWILNDTSLCARPFTDPEALYTHLTEFHVGRKNAGNLCLHCRVMGCTQNTTAFTKRDHITSHLRSHVPLKANPCESCAKSFKWPHDLRKHYAKTGHGPVVEAGGESAGGTKSLPRRSSTVRRKSSAQRRPSNTTPIPISESLTSTPTATAPLSVCTDPAGFDFIRSMAYRSNHSHSASSVTDSASEWSESTFEEALSGLAGESPHLTPQVNGEYNPVDVHILSRYLHDIHLPTGASEDHDEEPNLPPEHQYSTVFGATTDALSTNNSYSDVDLFSSISGSWEWADAEDAGNAPASATAQTSTLTQAVDDILHDEYLSFLAQHDQSFQAALAAQPAGTQATRNPDFPIDPIMSTMNENERTVRAQNEQTIRATSIVGSSSAYPSFIQSIPAFSTDNTNTNYLLNADQLLYLMNDSENTVRASSSSPHVGSAPTSSFQHPLQQLHSTPPTPEHESPHVGGELFDTNTPHYNDSSLGSLHQHLASLSDPYTTVRRRDTSRPPSIFPMKAGVTSVGFSSNWLDEQADVQPPVQEPEQFGAVWPPETVFGVTPGLHSQYFFTPDPTQR